MLITCGKNGCYTPAIGTLKGIDIHIDFCQEHEAAAIELKKKYAEADLKVYYAKVHA
jgi:hypothetical protein